MILAIKGHPTRGGEVTQLLEMLGGENWFNIGGAETDGFYYIYEDNKKIYHCLVPNVENVIVFTLEEFLEKFPYKVGDKVTLDNKLCSITWMCWECNNIYYQVQGIDTMFTKKVIANDLQPYKEETNNKPKSYAVGLKDGEVIECGVNMGDNKVTDSRIDFSLTEKIELDLGDTHEVVVENGKTYVVKKKPTYPKYYTECEASGLSSNPVTVALTQGVCMGAFAKLIVIRNAYWEIAGAEMGLGKDWEPDWRDSNFKYCLKKMGDNIEKVSEMTICCILAFPTAEIRDTFYENFKEEIEMCKELLQL